MTQPSITRVSFDIPYTCQFASADLVSAFLTDGQPLESDPNWADYGVATPADYAHWAMRSCGVVCVKMAIEGLGGPDRSIMEWIEAGLALDGYLTERRAERPVEKGWKHGALAELARLEGLSAELVSGLGMANVVALIRTDRCFLASVSPEIGEGNDAPITRRNGHIVVIYGFEADVGGNPTHLLLHNPSGRSEALRAGARVPVGRFAEAFSGRGIAIGSG